MKVVCYSFKHRLNKLDVCFFSYHFQSSLQLVGEPTVTSCVCKINVFYVLK